MIVSALHRLKRKGRSSQVLVALMVMGAVAVAGCSSNDSKAGASTSKGPALTKSEIAIGVVGGFSGACCAAAKNMPTVMKAWAEWKNNTGGINGHPVKVIAIDDKADPAASTAAVKKLVEDDKVVAIVGQADAGLEGTWAEYVKSKNIPVVGGYAYTPTWTTNPMFFPSTATLTTAVFSGPFSGKQSGKTTYGVINCAEQSACAQAIEFHKAGAAAAGMKVGYTATVAVTAPNYTANCIAAKDAGVDKLSLGISPDAAIRLAADCKRQGYSPEYSLPATSLTNKVLSSPNLDGASVPLVTFPWFLKNDQTKDFEAVTKLAGFKDEDVAPADAVSFVSAQLFAKALANAPDAVTSQDVLSGLYTIKNESLGGLTGPLTFSADDKPGAREVKCYSIAEIKGGKLNAPQGMKQSCIS
jgi:branched-chain amino acid transport system substrate-binding protein